MDDQPEKDVLYTVSREGSGQWAVLQAGFREPLACFREQRDAVEYAERLASMKTSADVEIAAKD